MRWSKYLGTAQTRLAARSNLGLGVSAPLYRHQRAADGAAIRSLTDSQFGGLITFLAAVPCPVPPRQASGCFR